MKNPFLIHNCRFYLSTEVSFVVTEKTVYYDLEIIKFRDILDFTQFILEFVKSIRIDRIDPISNF